MAKRKGSGSSGDEKPKQAHLPANETPATEIVENPFGDLNMRAQSAGGMSIEQERAIGEVMAAVMMAKRFPRQLSRCADKILKACTRVTLAEEAEYAYPRGGQEITGPSIRLAEVCAQNWENIQFGMRELSREDDASQVEAYAWDLETNVRRSVQFTVPHVRDTKSGAKELRDERDKYELIANMGQRRVRACILAVIPGDMIDAARKQCAVTLQNKMGAPEEQIEALVKKFSEFGITEQMLSQRLGHHLRSTIAAEVISLRRIYLSIRDGMSKPSQWFDDAEEADVRVSDLAEELRKRRDQNGNGAGSDASTKEAQKDQKSGSKPKAKQGTGAESKAADKKAPAKKKSEDASKSESKDQEQSTIKDPENFDQMHARLKLSATENELDREVAAFQRMKDAKMLHENEIEVLDGVIQEKLKEFDSSNDEDDQLNMEV